VIILRIVGVFVKQEVVKTISPWRLLSNWVMDGKEMRLISK